MTFMRVLVFLSVMIVLGALALLLTGNRILVREEKLAKGTYYVHPQSGEGYNVGSGGMLACHYFTGRSVLTTMFYYSSNNNFGKESCPFLLRAN